MNLPIEFLPLQKMLWGGLQDSAQNEQTLAVFRSGLREFFSGLGWPLLIAAILFCLAIRFYHPRVPRGGFWTPLFGLFGGTETITVLDANGAR